MFTLVALRAYERICMYVCMRVRPYVALESATLIIPMMIHNQYYIAKLRGIRAIGRTREETIDPLGLEINTRLLRSAPLHLDECVLLERITTR